MIPDDNNNSGAEISALKNQIFTLLVALLVLSGTFMVYLFRLTSAAGKDLAQGNQLLDTLNRNENNISVFAHKLVDFGEKHPDFKQQVLAKYGITVVSAPPSASAVAPKK